MFTYIGGGNWIPGVPARDLTNAEAKEYGVEDSDLYEKAAGSPGPVDGGQGPDDDDSAPEAA